MAAKSGLHRSGLINAIDLPGNYLGDQLPLFVGIQSGDEILQITPMGSTDEAAFAFDFRLIDQENPLDVRGPFIHGRKGDRFVYLVWGHAGADEPFVRYARSKLMFNDIPPELLQQLTKDEDQELVATVQATNHKGTEASGTVRPPAISWDLVAKAGQQPS